MEVLITGGEGVVASYIDFGVRLAKSQLDVTNLSNVMAVCQKHAPKVIVHLAATTDLVRCEQEPAYAYTINAVGTYNAALAAREVGAKLIYISTSDVFDGTKETPYEVTDTPNPVNVYGHSKYLGELTVQGMLENFLIVRTSWVFGGGKDKDKKFVGKILMQKDNAEISAVADKRGAPTYAKDLAHAIKSLIQEGRQGIVHVGGAPATRYDIAKEIVSITGSSANVVPAVSTDFPNVYVTGPDESMVISVPMRPWREALAEYIHQEWNNT